MQTVCTKMQNSIGTFCAPVVTQVKVKLYGKSLIFESMPLLYQSTFSGSKDVCRASSDRKISKQKETLAPNTGS